MRLKVGLFSLLFIWGTSGTALATEKNLLDENDSEGIDWFYAKPDTTPRRVRMFDPHSRIGRNNHSLSVKTNAVGWGMLAMNLAVEYDATPALSVVLPVYYSPFNYFTRSRKLRMFAVQPELRYWFEHVDGLFAGGHIGVSTYNYAKKDGTYRYQDADANSPLFNIGVSGGYRIPLGKSKNWCVEFSLGAGYAYLHHDRFFNIPDGAYVDTRTKHFFGIDHVGLSLSYRINWKGGEK